MDNINILVESKKQYTNQLHEILKPRIYEGYKSIYEDIINESSKELEEKKIQSSSIIKIFQRALKDIPDWNQETIKKEYARIEKLSNCDYIDTLIEAVFITNTKILTSVQINNKEPINIKINIPQPTYFIHKCYILCAKELYKNPYIFDQSKSLQPKDRHNNIRETLRLIEISINNAISELLPIKDILKNGLINKTNIQDNVEIIKTDIKEMSDDRQFQESKEDIKEKVEVFIKDDILIEKVEDAPADSVHADASPADASPADASPADDAPASPADDAPADDAPDEDSPDEDAPDEDAPSEDAEDSESIEGTKDSPEEDDKDDNNGIKSIKIVNLNKNKIYPTKEPSKETKEIKNILYNKYTPPFASKIKNVLKIDLNESKNNTDDNIDVENKSDIKTAPLSVILKENSKENSKEGKSSKKNNPFIKQIKSNKFFINKTYNKKNNKSFYQKKYESNSANYHSITETIKTTIDELQDTLKNTLKDTNEPFKIIKNKIMLDDVSSDEDELELEL